MNYTVINSYENLGNKNCHNRSEKKRDVTFLLLRTVSIVKMEKTRWGVKERGERKW
jgi:hypothetical protein